MAGNEVSSRWDGMSLMVEEGFEVFKCVHVEVDVDRSEGVMTTNDDGEC